MASIWKYECVCECQCAHQRVCTYARKSYAAMCWLFLCLQVCLSMCLHLRVSVCAYSCPRCALLISYQGSLFAGWQVAISPLIRGLFVRWELHWEHMTKHFTSASFPHFFSLPLDLPALFLSFLPLFPPPPRCRRPIPHSTFPSLNITAISLPSLFLHILSLRLFPSSSSIFIFPPMNNIILSPWSKKRRTV